MQQLLDEWSKWHPSDGELILESDREVLSSPKSRAHIAPAYTSWEQVYSHTDLGKPGNTDLQLGLIPHPFCGDILNAEVYLLMLNPGYGPHDYYAQLEVPAYREEALKNLRQDIDNREYPFYLLNPMFAWSGGFSWWHRKLAPLIEEIATETQVSFADARKFVSQRIANIELIPYHSTSFYDRAGWMKRLPSAQLAREFVRDYVFPRVERGEAIIIVTRQVREWNLPDHDSVTIYSGSESRSAHLTPSSTGGRAIINRLLQGRFR